ncbi:MAG TPA: hypothetical protein VFW29_11635 [Solirubrobacteraceae bacterium]|nr:hypothetical protein [Solirubrobacteraceae bacterium]
MGSTGYKLLGFAVWRGGRWYLRRRLSSRRSVLARLLLAGMLAAGGAALVRRIAA